MTNEYLKADWGIFTRYDDKEKFVKYTIRHKIRLFIGIRGQMQDGSYCFGKFDKIPSIKIRNLLYDFMFYFGNRVLNGIIGYNKL